MKGKRFDAAGEEEAQSWIKLLAERPRIRKWQIEQAAQALEILYGRVVKTDWGKNWKARIPEAGEGVRSLGPGRDQLAEELKGRGDGGELPGRYEGFLNEVAVAIRASGYAYRTEETYLHWIKRFLKFALPANRDSIRKEDVRLYLDYLAVVRGVKRCDVIM